MQLTGLGVLPACGCVRHPSRPRRQQAREGQPAFHAGTVKPVSAQRSKGDIDSVVK